MNKRSKGGRHSTQTAKKRRSLCEGRVRRADAAVQMKARQKGPEGQSQGSAALFALSQTPPEPSEPSPPPKRLPTSLNDVMSSLRTVFVDNGVEQEGPATLHNLSLLLGQASAGAAAKPAAAASATGEHHSGDAADQRAAADAAVCPAYEAFAALNERLLTAGALDTSLEQELREWRGRYLDDRAVAEIEGRLHAGGALRAVAEDPTVSDSGRCGVGGGGRVSQLDHLKGRGVSRDWRWVPLKFGELMTLNTGVRGGGADFRDRGGSHIVGGGGAGGVRSPLAPLEVMRRERGGDAYQAAYASVSRSPHLSSRVQALEALQESFCSRVQTFTGVPVQIGATRRRVEKSGAGAGADGDNGGVGPLECDACCQPIACLSCALARRHDPFRQSSEYMKVAEALEAYLADTRGSEDEAVLAELRSGGVAPEAASSLLEATRAKYDTLLRSLRPARWWVRHEEALAALAREQDGVVATLQATHAEEARKAAAEVKRLQKQLAEDREAYAVERHAMEAQVLAAETAQEELRAKVEEVRAEGVAALRLQETQQVMAAAEFERTIASLVERNQALQTQAHSVSAFVAAELAKMVDVLEAAQLFATEKGSAIKSVLVFSPPVQLSQFRQLNQLTKLSAQRAMSTVARRMGSTAIDLRPSKTPEPPSRTDSCFAVPPVLAAEPAETPFADSILVRDGVGGGVDSSERADGGAAVAAAAASPRGSADTAVLTDTSIFSKAAGFTGFGGIPHTVSSYELRVDRESTGVDPDPASAGVVPDILDSPQSSPASSPRAGKTAAAGEPVAGEGAAAASEESWGSDVEVEGAGVVRMDSGASMGEAEARKAELITAREVLLTHDELHAVMQADVWGGGRVWAGLEAAALAVEETAGLDGGAFSSALADLEASATLSRADADTFIQDVYASASAAMPVTSPKGGRRKSHRSLSRMTSLLRTREQEPHATPSEDLMANSTGDDAAARSGSAIHPFAFSPSPAALGDGEEAAARPAIPPRPPANGVRRSVRVSSMALLPELPNGLGGGSGEQQPAAAAAAAPSQPTPAMLATVAKGRASLAASIALRRMSHSASMRRKSSGGWQK